MIHGQPPRPPLPAAIGVPLAVGALMVAIFAVFHQITRGLVGVFGSPWTSVALACVGTAAGGLMLLPLLPVLRLPWWWWARGLPLQRKAAGRCPDCGYHGVPEPCAECGGDGRVAVMELLSWRSAILFTLLLLATMAAGVLSAETRVRVDERDFVAEVNRLTAGGHLRPHARARASPCAFATLQYDPAEGFLAPPPFDTPRIPGWRGTRRQVPETP
jgi:hypothetical protein